MLSVGEHDSIRFGMPTQSSLVELDRAGWESLLEMESMDLKGGEQSHTVTLVVVLTEAIEKRASEFHLNVLVCMDI